MKNASKEILSMVMNRSLSSIAVFYRNDAPGGFGLMLMNNDGKLMNEFRYKSELYDKAWAESSSSEKSKLIKGYFEQIKWFLAMDQASRPEKWHWQILLNIWFLEKHGHIHSDDFNGLIFTYIQ